MTSTHVGLEVSRRCLCWRLARQDGIILGFTNHDRDILVGGIVYEASPGMIPSAIVDSASLEASQMAIQGVLSSDRISAADLVSGRWNHAQLLVFACDWERPDETLLPLASGRLGEIRQDLGSEQGRFAAELLSPDLPEARRACVRCAPLCRASLGDLDCGVSLAGRFRDILATTVASDLLVPQEAVSQAEKLVHGQVLALSGPLCGLRNVVEAVDAEGLRLREAWPTSEAEFRIRIWEGCNKMFETCRERFANSQNFRGEPHLPGTDALLRYAI
ncbi:MAG: DUF2163 domain-containing protein [Sphingomonadaceae bacterium]